MKLTATNIGVIMVAIVAISSGLTYAFMEASTGSNNTPSLGALLTGNVKVTQLDGEGNVIAYRQTDNHIVKNGMEIIMTQLFDDVNQSGWVTVNYTGPVSHMEIGLDGEWQLYHNDTDVRDSARSQNILCLRVDAVIDNGTSDGPSHAAGSSCVEPACRARMNVTAMGTFMGANCFGGNTIDEAGIFNNETAGIMFARNTFGGVTLMMPDTLQLDWQFTFLDS